MVATYGLDASHHTRCGVHEYRETMGIHISDLMLVYNNYHDT